MKTPATVPLEQLDSEPYASVVCYPRATPTEIQNRISELREHEIEALEFSGNASAFNVPVLGKGYVGIVVVAHARGERYALKMRRVDADRTNLQKEAELLQKANAVEVGPRFVTVSDNFLLSQLVDGDLLWDWLEKNKTAEVVRGVLVDILEQCWRLDQAGLDHGELSKAPKHLLVDKSGKPFIVDFETSSTQRNASNVTSVCQFLFQGNSNVCKAIAKTFGQRDRNRLIVALKLYKKDRNRRNFGDLLGVCLS